MTTTLTCAELYATDATFRSAVEKWVADRRCPVQLGDFLEELGLPDAADCARWCYDQPDRPVYATEGVVCGPYPKTGFTDDPNYWCCKSDGRLKHANEVPLGNVSNHSKPTDDTHAAIVFLLDAWRRTE